MPLVASDSAEGAEIAQRADGNRISKWLVTFFRRPRQGHQTSFLVPKSKAALGLVPPIRRPLGISTAHINMRLLPSVYVKKLLCKSSITRCDRFASIAARRWHSSRRPLRKARWFVADADRQSIRLVPFRSTPISPLNALFSIQSLNAVCKRK